MFVNQLKKQLQQKQPLFIGEATAFRSAVLVPLVQVEKEWHVLFEVRTFTMKQHPGDISFPGGKIDQSDASPLAAVLRETEEELGIHSQTITIVGALSPYIASPSFVIYPFVGVVDYAQIMPGYNREEVETVFTIPLRWLLNYTPYRHTISFQVQPAPDFPFEKIMNGERYQWRTREMEEWFYDYPPYTIWGLTARILKFFVAQVKQLPDC